MGCTDSSSRECRSRRLIYSPRRPAGTTFLSRFRTIRQRFGARAAAIAFLASIALIAPSALAQDTTAPTITSVTISSTPSFDADGDNTADTYIRGDRIVVDVRFSEAVAVSGGNGNVRLRLDLGADDTNLANSRRVLGLKSVVGSNTLRFEHTVQRRDSDLDGVWVQTLTASNAQTVHTVGTATVASATTGTAAVLTTSGLPTSGAATHKVDGSRTEATANRPPAFPTIPPGTPVTLYIVDENNAAGARVVTVAATDPDGDALTYSLDSASDAVFDIDSSGNITVTAANALDHETQDKYTITVSVHDGKDASGAPDTTVDATRSVRIVVANSQESPVFPANAPTTFDIAENNSAGAPVGTVSATDSDGDALTYALDSASDTVFDIDSSGNITVTAANALDYETKASYAVTVSVHDGKDAAGDADTTVDATHSLTITVRDLQETPSGLPTIASVTISSTPSYDADGDSTADTYIRGDRIVVDVRFSEAVTVSGGNNSVRLRLDIGADDTNLANSRRVLMLKSVVGGNALRFEHTVQRRDSDPDGVWVQTGSATSAQTVFTVGGAVTSTAAGVAAVLTKSGLPTTGAATHKVDGSRTRAANPSPAAVPAKLESAATEPQGRGLILTFTKEIVISGLHTAYTVRVDGARRETVSAFWDGNTVGLVLVEPVRTGETVTVAYAKPARDFVLHDADELAIDSFGPVSVTNTVQEVPAVLAPAEPVVSFDIFPGGGSLTSTRFFWRLPVQPAGVTVSAVEVQVHPRRMGQWSTVASLTPVADGEEMVHTVIGLTPGEWCTFRIRLVTNSGNADSESLVMVKMGLPKPVTNLSVSNVTRTTADLSWTMPPIVDSSPSVRALNVQQRGASGSWTTVATITPDDRVPPELADDEPYDRSHRMPTLYTVTGLTAGTSYTFRIRLVAGRGNADSETVSTTTQGGSLNPAGGLTASNPTATTIDLAWALPTQPAGVTVTGLEVQQQSAGSWTTVVSLGATGTSHTVTGLTEGTTYTFRVRLAANNGTVDSETVSATALAPPKPATGLAVSNQSRTGIDLSWTLPAHGTSITVSAVEVQYKLGAAWSRGWSTIATLASDTTSHSVTQVTPGTSYAFRIRLVTNNGYADSRSVKATALEPPKPATGLSFSNVTGETVDLSWTLPAQPEGVIVTGVEVQGGLITRPGEEVPDFSSYALGGKLAADATSQTWPVIHGHGDVVIHFRVRLFTNSGNVDSEIASWSSTRPYPKPATDLTASNATQRTVDLAWTLPEQSGVTVSAVEVYWDLADDEDDRWSKETLAANATSHTVTGLSAGTAYNLHVRLVTSGGDSYAVTVSVTTPSGTVSTPGVSVADASANEGADAAVEFVVSLSRVASRTVTVDYATANIKYADANGGAIAGEDYTAVSGTLTFAAGEREKSVSVPILDDVLDEGSETFLLRLSNAQGAWISDAEATGTITNSDSMPKAWTARFGRSVAVHVVEAVEQRLEQAPSESWAQLGGHQMGGSGDVVKTVRRLAPYRDLWAEPDAVGAPGQDMTPRQLLLGSAFHLVSNGEDQAGRPRLSVWGRVASSGFEGQEDKLSLDGTVTTATLGGDGAWKRWLTGLLLAYSEGDGSFSHADMPGGDVTSSLTSVHPYVAYTLSDRARLWGMVGYGSGALRLEPEDQRAMDTDLTMTMGAVGVRGSLLQPAHAGGFDLALRSDVLWTVVDSAAADNLAATEADASRFRLILEGSRPVALEGGGSFTPSLELGLRHDGGDAETGTGVEVGGSLRFTSAWGLSIEASVRGLLAHEATDYREWGVGGALRFDPGRQGRGFTASIVPEWGAAASGAERMWNQPGTSRLPLSSNTIVDAAAGRLQAELGYGLAALNGRGLLTPYARVALSEGADQAWHLGTRLALAETLNFSLEASRRARHGEAAAHELALLANVGF